MAHAVSIKESASYKFCASRDGLRNSSLLWTTLAYTEVICAVYDYAGKADLSKSCLNLKKVGHNQAFDNALQFAGKKMA